MMDQVSEVLGVIDGLVFSAGPAVHGSLLVLGLHDLAQLLEGEVPGGYLLPARIETLVIIVVKLSLRFNHVRVVTTDAWVAHVLLVLLAPHKRCEAHIRHVRRFRLILVVRVQKTAKMLPLHHWRLGSERDRLGPVQRRLVV